MKIENKRLLISPNEKIPADLVEQVRKREINEIYVDVANREGLTSDAIIEFAKKLHSKATSTGAVTHPVVVGPFTRTDHILTRNLALNLIRITSQPFDQYVDLKDRGFGEVGGKTL